MLSDDGDNGSTPAQESQENEETDFSDDRQHPFSQNELNDLVRDLSLSKSSSELLASILKEKNLLSNGTCITFYRHRHQELLHFFFEEKDLVYCTDIVCKSLECHFMNPEIGDYLSTAARDQLNVFCFIMAISLHRFLLLTRLH